MSKVYGLLLLAWIATAASEDVQVTCGSLIKLGHASTKTLLHSHEIAYGTGSGQQSVTGNSELGDANSLWIVRSAKDATCEQGSPIPSGMLIRLQHAATRKWLHSHHFGSPLSNNQEVSCFGSNEQSDDGDVWRVTWEGSGSSWLQDIKVHLQQIQTGVFLASSSQKFQRPIAGQQEIFGRSKKDDWTATQGVFFPSRSAA